MSYVKNNKGELGLACSEQQTHFRFSPLSLRKIVIFRGRQATTGNASAVRRLKLGLVVLPFRDHASTKGFTIQWNLV